MTKRGIAAAAVAASTVAAYELWGRPWQRRWGATDEEVVAPLPGDDVIAAPATQVTRAISIGAPPEAVWPWIVQIGADRGGFYSYDWMENLVGLGIHSTDRVVEDWQDLAVGDVVYATSRRTAGWYVVDMRPEEALVLQVGNLAEGRPLHRNEELRWEFTWTFALSPEAGASTRLIVRERTAIDSATSRVLLAPMGIASFVMTRRMMLGVKSRAEASPTPMQR